MSYRGGRRFNNRGGSRGSNWKRYYGFFDCDECNSRWESSWVFKKSGDDYWTQDCKRCDNAVEPYKVEPIKCSICGCTDCICTEEERNERHVDPNKPHRSDLCSKCRAGYPCARR